MSFKAQRSNGEAEAARSERLSQGASRVHWHHLSAEATLDALDTAPGGLSSSEAARRLALYGHNHLPEGSRSGVMRRFLLHFHNILIYVLLGSAAITASLGHLLDTGVILAVVLANAIIGFIQEGKAENAMDAIRHMLAPRANVLRDGVRTSLDGTCLVPGDVVLLAAGDKVPADIRLLSAHGLAAQEAILTGESAPVAKAVEPVTESAVLGDRTSQVFSGTLITSGQGSGVVTATGTATEIGRISGLVSGVETLTTPLVEQMDVFARWLTALILLVAALLLAFGYFAGHYGFSEIFMAVVGLSVAAIPEGLPAVLTITLAIGVQAMARRNAIVRRLPAIETLGSVSVICTDKTGTLTKNEMMAVSVQADHQLFSLDGTGYEPKGQVRLGNAPISPSAYTILEEFGRAVALCNDAGLRQDDGLWTAEGDPMEGALLALAGKLGVNVHSEKSSWMRTDLIPFDARHRFMATLNHGPSQHACVFVKGAPEAVVAMCVNQRNDKGGADSLDKAYWREQADMITAQGQRVLAVATAHIDPAQDKLTLPDLEDALTLLGLVGMIDPPRPETRAALSECRDAGIQVKMITGDHQRTAVAIGAQIGLLNPDNVLTGADLDNMDDTALQAAVLDCNIFARTSPEHKLRLVMALQARGMTVAMTGDGVNDAPALKRADAGIAMGGKGSEAAKEAAQLVLADDNFSSIVAAIREGRTVYDNIKKVIGWTLPTSTGEAMTIVVALLFGMTLPITPIQILWVNLITVVTLGVALAFEPTEANTMSRPPRPRKEPLLSGELAWHIVLVSLLFLVGVFGIFEYAAAKDYPVELARTMALNTLVVMEIFHLFYSRNIYGTSLTWEAVRATPVVWFVVVIITGAQFAVTCLPPLQLVFGTRAVAFHDGLLIVGVGVALFVVIEIKKQIHLRLRGVNTPALR